MPPGADSLYDDPGILELTGRTLIGAEVARHYGLTDVDGRQPPFDRRNAKDPPGPIPGQAHLVR